MICHDSEVPLSAGAFLYNHKLLLKFNHKIMQFESKGVSKGYSGPRIVPGAGMAGGIMPGDSQTTSETRN